MIIVKAIGTEQILQIYTRDHTGNTYDVIITDEMTTKKTPFVGINGTVTDGLLAIPITYSFKEGRFYMIEIFEDDTRINYSKIYATDQTDMPQYSVLNDYYTTPPVDENEYIIAQ